MIFNKDSYLVKIWLGKVNDKENNISIDDVPELFNLKEVVLSLLPKE